MPIWVVAATRLLWAAFSLGATVYLWMELQRAVAARRYLRASGKNGYRDIVARGRIAVARVLLVATALALALGLAALRSPIRAQATMTPLQSWYAMFATAILLGYPAACLAVGIIFHGMDSALDNYDGGDSKKDSSDASTS